MSAAPRPDKRPETREPLTRDRVLRAAIALADDAGFPALTMRRLGQSLGVEAMSLYNHVASKDDLRDGIVEIVLGEIDVPEDASDWKEAIRVTAISSHDVFLRHRWACNLMMRVATVGPARMRWMDFVLRTFREAGFSAEMAHHAYHALDSHITGFTLWEVGFPFETREEMAELATGFLRTLPRDEYPYLAEHVEWHLNDEGGDGPSEFEFGLNLILDGLERLRDAVPYDTGR